MTMWEDAGNFMFQELMPVLNEEIYAYFLHIYADTNMRMSAIIDLDKGRRIKRNRQRIGFNCKEKLEGSRNSLCEVQRKR